MKLWFSQVENTFHFTRATNGTKVFIMILTFFALWCWLDEYAVAAFQLEPGVGKSTDAVANFPPLANFLLSYALKFQKPGVGS